MKVINKGSQVINVVLSSGEKKIKKGDIVDMPEWVYKMLRQVYPNLTVAEVVIEAKPEPVEPKPEVKAKNVKSKKSRK